jgi:hypothetical protein
MAESISKRKQQQKAHGKTYYAMGPMRVASNKKRRMKKHIRSHPADKEARRIYGFEKNYGPTKDLGLNSAGRHRAMRAGMALA